MCETISKGFEEIKKQNYITEIFLSCNEIELIVFRKVLYSKKIWNKYKATIKYL